MKHFISAILPTMLLCMFGAKAYAYDIAVNNADGVTIYYNFINNDRNLEVTYLYEYDEYALDFKSSEFDDVYVGDVVIPEEVTYSDVTRKVTQIGKCAFSGCSSLTSITIPSTVTRIGMGVFGFMDLESVVSLIQDPFDLSNDWVVPMFTSNTFENATLYVPVGTINKYKTKNGWKDFVHIKEGLPTGIEAPERKGVNELKRYDLSGRTVKNSSRGVNIIQMDDGTTKKVIVK